MNTDMAIRAVPISRVGHVMPRGRDRISCLLESKRQCAVVAFQAEREGDRTLQQPRIGGAVRIVAGFTALYAHWRMLERKWAALFRVAFQARLLVAERLLHHVGARRHSPRGSEGAVRIMTVRTGHKALVNSMFKGHRKIGADIGVAGIAKFRLCFGKQILRSVGLVY